MLHFMHCKHGNYATRRKVKRYLFLNQTPINRKKCFVESRISEKFLRHFAKVYDDDDDDDAERHVWWCLVGGFLKTPRDNLVT